MAKREYKWGETPLDDLSHEELLIVAKRLYMATTAARGAMGMVANISHDEYWTARNGAGAIALERCKQALRAIDGKRSEPAQHTFYRYAGGLLFDHSEFNTGDPWLICGTCGNLICTANPNVQPGQSCRIGPRECQGIYRLLTLDDLKPLGRME